MNQSKRKSVYKSAWLIICSIAIHIACVSPCTCTSQSRFYFSAEPNLMLANRKINPIKGSSNYLSSHNALGFGLNLGFEKDLGNNFYAESSLQLLNLRNSVNVDLLKSGFTNASGSTYDNTQHYSMGYMNAFGIRLTAGHNFNLTPATVIKIGLGFHVHNARFKAGGGMLVTSKNSIGLSQGLPIYEEHLTCSSNATFGGLDLTTRYVVTIKRKSFGVGFHYAMNPSRKINGSFITFPYFKNSDAGTFELSTNYLGLTLELGFNTGQR